jgi:hypothetical protein
MAKRRQRGHVPGRRWNEHPQPLLKNNPKRLEDCIPKHRNRRILCQWIFLLKKNGGVSRTTSARATRFEVLHEALGFARGVFDAQGIGTIPTVKLLRNLGSADPMVLNQVEVAVKQWLGMGTS